MEFPRIFISNNLCLIGTQANKIIYTWCGTQGNKIIYTRTCDHDMKHNKTIHIRSYKCTIGKVWYWTRD